MKKRETGTTKLPARNELIYGCMNLAGDWSSAPLDAERTRQGIQLIDQVLELGIHRFDHADIYCRGKSEELFGEFLKNRNLDFREGLFIQSKAGIRFGGDPDPDSPGRYDFSEAHLEQQVDASIRRLKCGYLDMFLLHRPDALVEKDELVRVLEKLYSSGRVRAFGVSNQPAYSIELLRSWLPFPIMANQLEFSLGHRYLVEETMLFNQDHNASVSRTDGTLAYCQKNDIQVQAWSPLFKGRFFAGENEQRYRMLREVMAEIGRAHGVRSESVMIAWILRHPAGIIPVIGSGNIERIAAALEGTRIRLSREEWYKLLKAAREEALP